jgi:hypothetical protein
MSLKSPGKRKFGASSPPPPTSTAISPKHIQSPSNSSSGRKRSAPSVSPSDMVERQPPQPRKITKKAVEAVAIANVVEEEEEKVKVQPPTERKRKVFSAKKGAAVATISSVSPSSEKVNSDILAQAMKQASEDRKKRAERRRSATDLVGTVSKAIGSLLIW